MKYFLKALVCITFLLGCNPIASEKKFAQEKSLQSDGLSIKDSSRRNYIKKILEDTSHYTSIKWIDSTYQELPTLKEGDVEEIKWRFKNTGNHPLIVININAGCGCTLAEKPEKPLLAGEVGVLKAKFSSKGQLGMHRKVIDVLMNTKGTTIHVLSFGVNVKKSYKY